MAKGERLWSVDGRTAHEWVASITLFLEWRQGRMPRKHPEHDYYLCGYRTLMQAWLAPERDDPARIAELNAEAVALGLPVYPPIQPKAAQPIPFPAKPSPYKPKRRAA